MSSTKVSNIKRVPLQQFYVAMETTMTNFGRTHIELSNGLSTTFVSKIEVEIKGFESFTWKNSKNGCHGNSFLVRSLKIEHAVPFIVRNIW